ncbi:hypothetical protein GCM10027185_11430 [Spirosoma pulveris]
MVAGFNCFTKFDRLVTAETRLLIQLPLHIPQLDVFTDDELVRFCLANPELTIERDENGNLYINISPTHLLTSSNNSESNT